MALMHFEPVASCSEVTATASISLHPCSNLGLFRNFSMSLSYYVAHGKMLNFFDSLSKDINWVLMNSQAGCLHRFA